MTLWDYRSAYELREQQAEAEKQSARERDRRHRELRERVRLELEEKIERRLKENARRRAEREAAEEERQERILARVDAQRDGRPTGAGGAYYADPVAAWRDAIAAAKRRIADPVRAVRSVVDAHPGLRELMVAEADARRTVARSL